VTLTAVLAALIALTLMRRLQTRAFLALRLATWWTRWPPAVGP
jgi:hypothetical protein